MVIKMQESGFCFGARRAVDRARQYEHERRQVVLLGNIVNNENVVREFTEKGFCVLEDVDLIPENAVVIIRAHGVPRITYDKLREKNAHIEDCTCDKVKQVHEIVQEKSRNGYKIIIVGKKDHPEVVGTLGWCLPGSAAVIEKESELENIDLTGKICVVAQTTCSEELWNNVTGRMLKRNDSTALCDSALSDIAFCETELCDTLCDVMRKRKEKAREIAGNVDVMVVIGDGSSSNSRELYRECQAVCKNTFFVGSYMEIENDAEIRKAIFGSTKIGMAGSASAPDNVIDDVYQYLLFMDFLNSARKELEEYTQKCFAEFRSGIVKNAFVQDALESLRQQNEGGKRIRGAMIQLGEQIASHGKNKNYLPVAVGYELFQTAVLIHDDIIDRGATRRGKETIHVQSAKEIKKRQEYGISAENADHYGVSRALCIGDYGFFIAYQFLAKSALDPSVLVKVYELYSQILTLTCEGEIMDTILPYDKISIPDHYEEYRDTVVQIYEYKTAWYTLAGPIMLGAICGGAGDELISLLKNIAIPLGIAFQIRDDLLGIYSDDNVLGKTVLSDIREEKQTLLLGVAYKNADEEQRNLLKQHYGKSDADIEDLKQVQRLFEETGAKKYAEDEIQRLSEYSKKQIQNDLIDKEYQYILSGLVNYLIDRKF